MKNIIKYVTLLTWIIAFLGNAGLASDANNVMTHLEAKINSARIKECPPEIKIKEEQLIKADPCQVLSLLRKYENDPCWPVREQAYWQEVHFAKLRNEPWIKHEVVHRLVKAYVDPNLGLSGQASTWLSTFIEKDFNNTAKLLIRETMDKKQPSKGTVLICGVANIQEELPRLKGFLFDELQYEKKTGEPWRYELGWKARLALARMGVKEDVDKCVSLIEQEIDKEIDSGSNFRLFDELGYIRQPAAIESLRKYLMCGERFRGTNPGMQGEPISNYVNDILAASLANYPVKKREDRIYAEKEIELARKWMSEQKEWKIIR